MTGHEVIELKHTAFEHYFSHLNPYQREAVFAVNGPVLMLAGAGSGKTTAIISRIVNMVYFGDGYNKADDAIFEDDAQYLQSYLNATAAEDIDRLRDILAISPIMPWNILAITFTNKAAGELKERLSRQLGEELAVQINASTFHSACVRILRRNISLLGFQSDFAIYDTDDGRRLMKNCMKEAGVDEKNFSVRTILNEISHAKDSLISPEQMEKEAEGNYRKKTYAKLYMMYQQRLRDSNAIDFDDIIYDTVMLFRQFPDTLSYYQNRFRYVLVDEYQDTNYAQYQLISLLTHNSRNLCVVGDDDQSIYRFRGATIENILGFEKEFPDCRVIRLEQNYRSTQNILNAANNVIANNTARKDKHLWCDAGDGEKIIWYEASSARDEAQHIVNEIEHDVENNGTYGNHAILYRMNAQSNQIEQILIQQGIPYHIYGGLRFYDRLEIRDIIAYLSIIENPNDMIRLERIINAPRRGIGPATLNAVREISHDLERTPLEVMRDADRYPVLSKKKSALQSFSTIWDTLIQTAQESSMETLLDTLLEITGYGEMLTEQGDEGQGRLENIEELKSSMHEYETENPEASLGGFLEEIALYTDVDRYEGEEDSVTLMTIHSAKGLEFECVYLIGMEDGIFPSDRNINIPEELEEERRLAYVAITRAKHHLTITTANNRYLFGQNMHNAPSLFLKEINPSLIEKKRSRSLMTLNETNRRSTSSILSSHSLHNQIYGTQHKKENTNIPSYQIGDRVRHQKFGDGTILAVTALSGDMMLEIGFDSVGTKRIMAKYGKVEKINN